MCSSTYTGIIFGGSGSIGKAIAKRATSDGNTVWICSTTKETDLESKKISFADFLAEKHDKALTPSNLDFACFAQGVNLNDSVFEFNPEAFDKTIEANCKFIIVAINQLLKINALNEKASLCIISSIWQELARSNKLSYSVSKAALKGLVLSLVADLAPLGHRVNAIMPGPIDNKMTRSNLTPSQLAFFESNSPYGRLTSVDEVVRTVMWLISHSSSGITGNFIKVHQGFGDVLTI